MTPISRFISNAALLSALLVIGLMATRPALADQRGGQPILLAQASSGSSVVNCAKFPELPPCKARNADRKKLQNKAKPQLRSGQKGRPKHQGEVLRQPDKRKKPQKPTAKKRQQPNATNRQRPQADRDRPKQRPAERSRQHPDKRKKAQPKPTRDKPRAERPQKERPRTERPQTERPRTERPRTERPQAERPRNTQRRTDAKPKPRPSKRPDARPRPRPDDRRDKVRRNDNRRDDRPHADRRRERPRPDRGGELEFSLPIPGVGGRVIIRRDGEITVRSRDDDRFSRGRADRRVENLSNGRTRTVVRRPDGVTVITMRDRDGEIIRRARRMPDGREYVLIDNTRARRDHRPLTFRPLHLDIPRERYIVDGGIGRRSLVEEALRARPVEPVERPYSLAEIRRNERLRAKMRRVDLSLTFAFNSAAIPVSQYDRLEVIGDIIADEIDDTPSDVFLIEGHTDAPGSFDYNLRLSDARAESVAIALTEYFGIPPENLVTQGYGEAYLKIDTPEREPLNRRVTVRRITPLLDGGY